MLMPIRPVGSSRGVVRALTVTIVLVSVGIGSGVALAVGGPATDSGGAGIAGPTDGYLSTFYTQSPSPNTSFAVSHLTLPAGKYMVSMTGEGTAFTNATASLSCSFSPTSKGYLPYGVYLDGSPRTIGAVGGVDLPSSGTVTFSCSAAEPVGKFVLLRGALSAVRLDSLTG
jgi:hypothetical protein